MSGENGPQKSAKPVSDEELAVALGYQPNRDQAPHVVAKGQGWLARQIVEVAEANGIEVREDADLVQILAQVDVDSEIPLEAFTLVAEILSYVYQKNKTWPEGMAPSTNSAASSGGRQKGG